MANQQNDPPAILLADVCRYWKGEPHQVEAITYLQDQISPELLEKFAEKWRNPPRPKMPSTMVYVTTEMLAEIALYAPASRFKPFEVPLNRTMLEYGINTRLRQAHFIGQLMHESGEFFYVEELASGDAYEGRADLGNTQPGDGRRYKGRGLIQITGRANYTDISKDWKVDVVSNPDLLKNADNACKCGGWYWNKWNINAKADRDDLEGVTRAINGGVTHINERGLYTERAKEVLGVK